MKLIRSIRYVLVILSAILGLLGLSSAFWYDYYNSCYTLEYYGEFPCIVASAWETISYNWDYNSVSNNLDFTYQSSIDYKAFSIWIPDYSQRYTLFWNSSNLLDIIYDLNTYWNRVDLVSLNYLCKYNWNDYTWAVNHCFGSSSNYVYTTDSFYSTVVSNNLQSEGFLYMPYRYSNDSYNSYNSYWMWGLLCLKYTNTYYCVNMWWNWSSDSYWNVIQSWIAPKWNWLEYYSYMFSNSPIWSSSWGWSSSTPSYQDPVAVNSKIYQIFVQQWYSDNLCYWGYSLDNILTTSTWFDLSDIRLWSGANIFELYNVYSWGLTFVNWYDTYFQYFNYARFSENYGTFNWKSKGLLWLMATKQAVNSSFDSTSIQNFCRLVINWLYETPVQTPIGIINDTVAEWQLSEVVWNIGYTPPASWSNIDIIVNTLIEQWVIDWYSWAEDLADFYVRYQDKLNQLRVKVWESWVLPWYITLWFFAILMLYFFKK